MDMVVDQSFSLLILLGEADWIVTANTAVRCFAHGPTIAFTDLFEKVTLPAHVPVIRCGQRRQVAVDGGRQFGSLKKTHGDPEMARAGSAGSKYIAEPYRCDQILSARFCRDMSQQD